LIAEPPPRLARLWPADNTRAYRGRHQYAEQRIVAREWVVAVLEPALLELPHHTPRRSGHHARDIFRFERGQREEGAGVMGGARVDTIEHQAMEMWREIQRRPESLNERNRRTVSCAYAMVTARAATLVREQGAKKRAQHLAREPRVPGTAIPERVRPRQHPVADRDFRHDAVYETGGGIGHSPSTTRGAEPSAFARKGDQAVVAAAIAVYPDETSGEHAAVEVATQLSLHESRDRCTLLTRMGEEGLELLADHFVEQCLLRLVALVLCHADPVGTGWKCGGRQKGL
jgi:hypothetical protein